MLTNMRIPEITSLHNRAILARCAWRDWLPDHLAVGAKAELLAVSRTCHAAATRAGATST